MTAERRGAIGALAAESDDLADRTRAGPGFGPAGGPGGSRASRRWSAGFYQEIAR